MRVGKEEVSFVQSRLSTSTSITTVSPGMYESEWESSRRERELEEPRGGGGGERWRGGGETKRSVKERERVGGRVRKKRAMYSAMCLHLSRSLFA